MTEDIECDYRTCSNKSTHYDDDLDAYLCDEDHDYRGGESGYCGNSCRLGYGCDQSC